MSSRPSAVNKNAPYGEKALVDNFFARMKSNPTTAFTSRPQPIVNNTAATAPPPKANETKNASFPTTTTTTTVKSVPAPISAPANNAAANSVAKPSSVAKITSQTQAAAAHPSSNVSSTASPKATSAAAVVVAAPKASAPVRSSIGSTSTIPANGPSGPKPIVANNVVPSSSSDSISAVPKQTSAPPAAVPRPVAKVVAGPPTSQHQQGHHPSPATITTNPVQRQSTSAPIVQTTGRHVPPAPSKVNNIPAMVVGRSAPSAPPGTQHSQSQQQVPVQSPASAKYTTPPTTQRQQQVVSAPIAKPVAAIPPLAKRPMASPNSAGPSASSNSSGGNIVRGANVPIPQQQQHVSQAIPVNRQSHPSDARAAAAPPPRAAYATNILPQNQRPQQQPPKAPIIATTTQTLASVVPKQAPPNVLQQRSSPIAQHPMAPQHQQMAAPQAHSTPARRPIVQQHSHGIAAAAAPAPPSRDIPQAIVSGNRNLPSSLVSASPKKYAGSVDQQFSNAVSGVMQARQIQQPQHYQQPRPSSNNPATVRNSSVVSPALQHNNFKQLTPQAPLRNQMQQNAQKKNSALPFVPHHVVVEQQHVVHHQIIESDALVYDDNVNDLQYSDRVGVVEMEEAEAAPPQEESAETYQDNGGATFEEEGAMIYRENGEQEETCVPHQHDESANIVAEDCQEYDENAQHHDESAMDVVAEYNDEIPYQQHVEEENSIYDHIEVPQGDPDNNDQTGYDNNAQQQHESHVDEYGNTLPEDASFIYQDVQQEYDYQQQLAAGDGGYQDEQQQQQQHQSRPQQKRQNKKRAPKSAPSTEIVDGIEVVIQKKPRAPKASKMDIVEEVTEDGEVITVQRPRMTKAALKRQEESVAEEAVLEQCRFLTELRHSDPHREFQMSDLTFGQEESERMSKILQKSVGRPPKMNTEVKFAEYTKSLMARIVQSLTDQSLDLPHYLQEEWLHLIISRIMSYTTNIHASSSSSDDVGSGGGSRGASGKVKTKKASKVSESKKADIIAEYLANQRGASAETNEENPYDYDVGMMPGSSQQQLPAHTQHTAVQEDCGSLYNPDYQNSMAQLRQINNQNNKKRPSTTDASLPPGKNNMFYKPPKKILTTADNSAIHQDETIVSAPIVDVSSEQIVDAGQDVIDEYVDVPTEGAYVEEEYVADEYANQAMEDGGVTQQQPADGEYCDADQNATADVGEFVEYEYAEEESANHDVAATAISSSEEQAPTDGNGHSASDLIDNKNEAVEDDEVSEYSVESDVEESPSISASVTAANESDKSTATKMTTTTTINSSTNKVVSAPENSSASSSTANRKSDKISSSMNVDIGTTSSTAHNNINNDDDPSATKVVERKNPSSVRKSADAEQPKNSINSNSSGNKNAISNSNGIDKLKQEKQQQEKNGTSSTSTSSASAPPTTTSRRNSKAPSLEPAFSSMSTIVTHVITPDDENNNVYTFLSKHNLMHILAEDPDDDDDSSMVVSDQDSEEINSHVENDDEMDMDDDDDEDDNDEEDDDDEDILSDEDDDGDEEENDEDEEGDEDDESADDEDEDFAKVVKKKNSSKTETDEKKKNSHAIPLSIAPLGVHNKNNTEICNSNHEADKIDKKSGKHVSTQFDDVSIDTASTIEAIPNPVRRARTRQASTALSKRLNDSEDEDSDQSSVCDDGDDGEEGDCDGVGGKGDDDAIPSGFIPFCDLDLSELDDDDFSPAAMTFLRRLKKECIARGCYNDPSFQVE